jgi:hypothetical protein
LDTTNEEVRVKKTIILVLVAILGISLIGPATAKRKKRKPKAPVPVELPYFLRMDAECTAPSLSLVDAEDPDCVYGDGGLADAYQEAGLLDMVAHYVAADGLPFVLDTARHVTGSIGIRGWNGAGVGDAQVDITLFGTIAGEEVELGTYSEAYTPLPQETKVIELDLEIDPAFAGATIEGLKLDIYSHGLTLGGRGVEHDEPVSMIKVPALK